MNRTLVIDGGKNETTWTFAEQFARILGNALCVKENEIPKELSAYTKIVWIGNKESEKLEFGREIDVTIDPKEYPTYEDLAKIAKQYRQEFAFVDGKKVPDQQLLSDMENYLKSKNTCALATGVTGYIRCTPIEYNYLHGCFYLFSEGGLKFIGIQKEDVVSLAIYDDYEGYGKLAGLQVMGKVKLVEPFCEEYNEVLAFKKIPVEGLKKQGICMHLIKIVPDEMEYLWSGFKKDGYASKQRLVFPLEK